ncbi:MAG: hypothetical protein HKN11_08825 [Rhizobiales bacterium]|nr:hypothetical protein [Hyphomicrobiales bacterium]
MSLSDIVSSNLDAELVMPVAALATAIREQHGTETLAILVYGSCLRGTPPTDSLIDYYVLTATTLAITGNPLSRLLCRLVPPNVYFAEHTIEGTTYRAKYAALTLDSFKHKVALTTANPYFWARFAQPVAMAYCRDETVRQQVIAALETAVRTMFAKIAPLSDGDADATAIWERGLSATYASELRSEGSGRSRQIVQANEAYYRAVTRAIRAGGANSDATGHDWARAQRNGKLLSVARLLKAAFTFRGGADYLAWKISRHSGQPVELTDWQRRHPILASLTLLPKLLKSGAVK